LVQIFGTTVDGTVHKFVVGNQQGEILPKMLFCKFKAIESSKVWGNPLTITVTDEQRDRLYAMAREAQLREISPFALPKPKKSKARSAKENVEVQKRLKVDHDE
jgi:hypothetical protein